MVDVRVSFTQPKKEKKLYVKGHFVLLHVYK
jgi:hypothetical protein